MGGPLVELDGISKIHHAGEIELRALRGVSFTVESGASVAITGPSGSGKSTLLNLIGCLDSPSSGRYLLDGRDVSRADLRERATLRNRAVGFLFESFNLLPRRTALENVELPLLYRRVSSAERRRRAADALEQVGLGRRIFHRPSQLSGEQQQRVAIARALVAEPKLIVADEPTGQLDSTTSVEVMALLQQLGRRGITLIVATHEPEIAAFTEREIALRDGEIASDRRHPPAIARPHAPRSPTITEAPR